MEPLTAHDLMSAAEYEQARPDFRRRMMLVRERRRVLLGDHCSVHFESRETLRYQVHEMLRIEHSWRRPGAIEDELAAYNPLVPRSGELSATLMFEYAASEERAVRLAELVGFERCLWLIVGGEKPLLADLDRRQLDAGKISSVQFVKWRLDDVQRGLLQQEGAVVKLVVDHPHYRAEAVLSEQARQELMHDPD